MNLAHRDQPGAGKKGEHIMRKSVRIGGTTVAALGFVLLGATSALAATPSITVTPSSGLSDGQQVAVAGSGFTASDTITLLECVSSATTVGCDTADAQTAAADDTGSFSTDTFTIRASFDGVDPQTGASTGQVDCTVSPGCSVIAADSAQEYSAVAISFG
jgi:hypothetical protein